MDNVQGRNIPSPAGDVNAVSEKAQQEGLVIPHTRRAFGCFQKVRHDEPLFTLLARDKFAPQVLRYWAQLVQEERGPIPKVIDTLKCADQMEHWQSHNGCKIPD